MKPDIRLTKPQHPNELLCIECGATRPTLHLPQLQIDAVTRTLAPLFSLSLMVLYRQKPELFEGMK